jgi:formylglycine-generating enzyme required for sulfatase activity
MSGNVWEWTWDWWYDDYPSGALSDPVGPGSGPARDIRGGSWQASSDCAVARRHANYPDTRYYSVGFRVVSR